MPGQSWSPRFAAGQRICQFEVLELIGRGGMGSVYKARDQRLGRLVALKFLSPDLVDSPEARTRFEVEARAISALSHPNIAVLYDLLEEAGQPFLVLEYLAGGTLRNQMRGRRLPYEQLMDYARQLASGLGHAHERNILHRDVKPENAIFHTSNQLKVTDFGIAKLAGARAITSQGDMMGTLLYMAPERMSGQPADQRADIYSLAVILFETIAGRLPFQGETPAALLHAILHDEPPQLPSLRPDLPDALRQVVERGLAKDPDRRYQTMQALIRDLDGASRASAGLPEEAIATITLPIAISVSHTRRRIVLGAAGAIAAAGAGLAVWPMVRNWTGGVTQDRKGLVLLPLESLSKSPEEQAFGAGLTEILASLLSQVDRFQKNISVIPTSEVRRQRVDSIAGANRLLNANLVLTGSLQKTPEGVRVVLNLVDSRTLRQIASRIVLLPALDSQAVERQLLSAAWQLLEFGQPPPAGPFATSAASPKAYEQYLLGQGHLTGYDGAASYEPAIQALEGALRLDPNFPAAKALVAEAYLNKYRALNDSVWLARADSASREALALDSRLAAAHVSRSLVDRATGRHAEAIAGLQRALELDPGSMEARRSLALVYDSANRPAEAEATRQEAIRSRPGYWPNYADLGAAYAARGDYGKAVEPLKLVVTLAPQNASGWRNLGVLWYKMGRWKEAAETLEKSIGMRPGAQAYSYLGTVQFFLGRYDDAAASMAKGVELAPKAPTLWGNLGDALAMVKDQAGKAKEAYQKAAFLAEGQIALNPKDANLRGSLAVYRAKLGDASRALEETAEALRGAPEDVDVLYKAARVYEMAGQRGEALRVLDRCLRRGYSKVELDADPEFSRLRLDPGYKRLMAGPK